MASLDFKRTFDAFVADEVPAIDQLRTLASGQLRAALDLSPQSLPLLDRFIANLTASPRWRSSELLATFTSDPESWLAVRVAYYLGACLRAAYGCQWFPSVRANHFSGTPAMAHSGFEFSPLEVGLAAVRGELDGGLTGVFAHVGALASGPSSGGGA